VRTEAKRDAEDRVVMVIEFEAGDVLVLVLVGGVVAA
jgi:hypothetical protein